MKYLVTGKEMKFLDENTTKQFHVPTVVLMEQAAQGFVRELLSFGIKSNKILVVCGNGNNGADGIAIARLLNQNGIITSVYFCAEGKKDSLFGLQKQIYMAYNYPIEEHLLADNEYDVVIDAIFGIGLSRNISGEYEEIIQVMNAMNGKKVAVDIPSGIDADNGQVLGVAFRADITITFSFGKVGQYLWPGFGYCNEVRVVPMGITQESWIERKPTVATYENEDLSLLPPRKRHSNKGTYGKLLVIAGSENMSGAASFCAKAAYRSGVGLVKIITPKECRNVLQTTIPEAILSNKEQLIEDLKWADAVVIGPGIGITKESEELLKMVLKNVSIPTVLDADALNILAKEPEQLLLPHTDMILTPHLGEMSRLTKDAISFLQTHLIESAQEFARKYNVICVLKDARTVTAIPYGLTYLNCSGNNGMATAGSGDVLSGVIGGLLAQGAKPEVAASLGVYLHGLAGDEVRKVTGARGMMASDILEGLLKVWNKVEE